MIKTMNIKFFAMIFAVLLTGCSSIKAPPECSGTARKINPESISVSAVTCEKGVA